MLTSISTLYTQLSSKDNPVTVLTGLKYTTSLIKILNNMTFLYDPNWEYEQGKPSYPIAFFFVKSMTEQMSSDISQRPMMFYNTASDTNDATKGGVMNIVADNIIIKPKVYKLEIVIPANGSALSNTLFNFENMSSVYTFLCSSERLSNNDFVRPMAGIGTAISVLKTLLKSLYGSTLSLSSVLNALLEQQDYNKASLEAMWRGRRILKLKLWNGWKFKYLAIRDLDIQKTGLDGDFYTATLICQEMPILSMRQQSKTSSLGLSAFSSALGKAQKAVVDTFISAMTAFSGEE
jgi:hypothetical protein